MPANHFWNIDFGAYSLSVNRRNLSYSLTETQTGTVWATDFPIGSVEITERETGITARYGFGELQMVSLSEKSGATGKRILFGLDAPGRIPVDVYLTCTEREIQLTVEASRDTKTHRVERVILLPGLCYVPDDGTSYLVIPQGEGTILFANNAPNETIPLPVWDADAGLTMPFIGAGRAAYPPDCPSAESCPPAPASGGVDAGEGASSATTYLREVSPLADDGRPTQRVPAGGGGQLSAGGQTALPRAPPLQQSEKLG